MARQRRNHQRHQRACSSGGGAAVGRVVDERGGAQDVVGEHRHVDRLRLGRRHHIIHGGGAAWNGLVGLKHREGQRGGGEAGGHADGVVAPELAGDGCFAHGRRLTRHDLEGRPALLDHLDTRLVHGEGDGELSTGLRHRGRQAPAQLVVDGGAERRLVQVLRVARAVIADHQRLLPRTRAQRVGHERAARAVDRMQQGHGDGDLIEVGLDADAQREIACRAGVKIAEKSKERARTRVSPEARPRTCRSRERDVGFDQKGHAVGHRSRRAVVGARGRIEGVVGRVAKATLAHTAHAQAGLRAVRGAAVKVERAGRTERGQQSR